MSAHDGGPAFPVAYFDHQTFAPRTVEEAKRLLSGMSLRDYFAGLAMQCRYTEAIAAAGGNGIRGDLVAAQAYAMADAMLAARAAPAAQATTNTEG